MIHKIWWEHALWLLKTVCSMEAMAHGYFDDDFPLRCVRKMTRGDQIYERMLYVEYPHRIYVHVYIYIYIRDIRGLYWLYIYMDYKPVFSSGSKWYAHPSGWKLVVQTVGMLVVFHIAFGEWFLLHRFHLMWATSSFFQPFRYGTQPLGWPSSQSFLHWLLVGGF